MAQPFVEGENLQIWLYSPDGQRVKKQSGRRKGENQSEADYFINELVDIAIIKNSDGSGIKGEEFKKLLDLFDIIFLELLLPLINDTFELKSLPYGL
mgnify:CR=1 FL=1